MFLLASCGPSNEHGGYKYEQEITCYSDGGEVIFHDKYVRVIPFGYGGGTWRISYPDSEMGYEFPMESCEVNHMEEFE